MSNEITKYDEMMAERARAVLKAEASGANKISTKGGRFSIEQQDIGSTIYAVILADRCVRSWFLRNYDPNSVDAPNCWAIFKKENEATAAPDPRCVQPQSATCSTCRYDVYGSSRHGRKGKDCGNARRLILIPGGAPDGKGGFLPLSIDEIQSMPLYNMRVPTTSMKAYENFAKEVARKLLVPPFGVLAEISLVPDPISQYKMTFKSLMKLDDSLGIVLMARAEEAESAVEFGFDPPAHTPPVQQPVYAQPAPAHTPPVQQPVYAQPAPVIPQQPLPGAGWQPNTQFNAQGQQRF